MCSSMERSPTEANSFSASQEIPSLWKHEVHHRMHNTPLLVAILAQIIQVYIPIFKIHFHITLPSTSKFPKWLPSLKFPY